MSTFKRIRAILASNIEEKFRKEEDPEVEVNRFIREIEQDLRELNVESDAALTAMNRTRRQLEECRSEMKKMERYAIKSLEADDEDKARRFLIEKANLKVKLQDLEKQYELASLKAEQMKLAQEKLKYDVMELRNKRDTLVGRLQVAESKKKAMEIGPSQSNVRLTKFDQLEEKANRALVEAEALEELRYGLDSDIEAVSSPYDESIDKEMTALKGKLK